VGQRIGAIAVVIVAVYMGKDTPHMFAQRMVDDHERLASATAMGLGLLEHEPDAAVIDRVLPPGSLREKAGEVGFTVLPRMQRAILARLLLGRTIKPVR
jgi:hypothetical protein